MATPLETIVGGTAVVLGLLWVVWPTKMMRYQTLVLYFGRIEPDDDHSDRERLLGRISGVLLAVLGVVLALDLAF